MSAQERSQCALQALIIARNQGGHHDGYANIYSSTAAIMFFGTPHNGSYLAAWGTRLSRMLYVSSTRRKIIESLTVGSEILNDITASFAPCLNDLVIVSVIELRPIGLLGLLGVVVSKESARMAVGSSVSLDRDHRGICRFEDAADNDYIQIERELKRLSSLATDKRLQVEATEAYNNGKYYPSVCKNSR